MFLFYPFTNVRVSITEELSAWEFRVFGISNLRSDTQ